MKVVLAVRAEDDLHEIWEWNVRAYGLRHADEYMEFLKEKIFSLGENHGIGGRIGSGDRRFLLILKTASGQGHIAVYRVTDTVEVSHVFHTSRDWRRSLGDHP